MTLEKTLRSGLSTSLHPHGEGEGKLLSGAFLLPRQTLQHLTSHRFGGVMVMGPAGSLSTS